MFEAQHEQTAPCHGCTGKTEDITRLQDRLTGARIGLAHAVVGNEELVNEQTHCLVRDVLIATACTGDLNCEDGGCLMDRIAQEKQRLVPRCSSCDHPCGRNDDYDMSLLWNADEDSRRLKFQLLFGVRGIAFRCPHTPTCIRRNPDGLITHAEYRIPAQISYLRASVIDEQGRRAWTNPIFLKD